MNINLSQCYKTIFSPGLNATSKLKPYTTNFITKKALFTITGNI